MCDLNCDIVKDLIPSYLDGICSEESKKAVEAHLAKCQKCRTHLDALKHTELSAGKAGQGQLDFMKRVKQYYIRKNVLGAALLFAVSVMMLPAISNSNSSHEELLYCALFTVLAVGTYLLLSNYQTKPKGNWQNILCGAACIFGAAYPACLMGLLYNCIATGQGIYGIELSRTGPYFNAQLIAVVVLELAVFAVCAADSVRKEYTFSLLPALNLVCCALCMSYRSILFHMDSPEAILRAILWDTAVFFLLAAGILLAEFVISRFYRSRIPQQNADSL